MKRIFAVILTSVLLLTLCGCAHTDHKDNADLPNQGMSAPETYAFDAQYIRTNGYSEDISYPYHVVIDSKEELAAYYEANKEFFDLERKEKVYSDTTIGFLDACDKYDDTYFERQNLVLIVLQEGSGSIRHEITDVRHRWDDNGVSIGWDITINVVAPEVVTDDMAQWHLFLEVQMGALINDEDKVWINNIVSGEDSNMQAHTPKEPPALNVSTEGNAITALRGTTSWMYDNGDGTWAGIESDSMHPLDAKEYMPFLKLIPISSSADQPYEATLSFDVPPDEIHVVCWEAKHWGVPDTDGENISVNDYSVNLKAGSYIYEVTAIWHEGKNYHGTAHYSFYTELLDY